MRTLHRATVTASDYALMGKFVDRVPEFIEEAREAQKQAVSYRDVLVGAALVLSDNRSDLSVLTGANIKPNKRKTTVCAEQVAYSKLTKENDKRFRDAGRKAPNFLMPLGIVVVSNTDRQINQDITGQPSPTLHMCANCRVRGANDPRVVKDMPVVTAHADRDFYQAFTQFGLNQMYDLGEYPELPVVRELTRWDARAALYDELVQAELEYPETDRRLPGEVAVASMRADLGKAA